MLNVTISRVVLPVKSKTFVLISARVSPSVLSQSLINDVIILVVTPLSSMCLCMSKTAMSSSNLLMCTHLVNLSHSGPS